jgi:hypothetical protein
MRPHGTCSITQSDTRRYINNYINDAISETPTHIPTRRATTGFPTALTVLALGLGLTILVMLGTWLSLSTRATARVMTFVAHPEEQTLSADELEHMGVLPPFLEDLLSRF